MTSRGSESGAVRFLTRSSSETRRLGASLGRLLAGDEIIHLLGGLGSGKTCFVQGLARGLGLDAGRPVTSPTFTLINEYPGPVPLFHVDLYRLEKPEEAERLGLEEYFGAGIVAVEWAEKLPLVLVRYSLEVRFKPLPDGARFIEIRAGDQRSATLPSRLRREARQAAPPIS